tara:strand:- start:9814 stop:10467 length:654 start_codon:yes stop_codon:yes gene_type:complete
VELNKKELFANLHFEGFILYPVDSKSEIVTHCVSQIKAISEGEIKDGYQLEKHLEFSSNLRPSVKDYDPKFEEFYSEIGVTSFLEDYLNYEPKISTLQLRGAYSGSSYLSWHRDTHFYSNAEEPSGNIPPIFKSIFYPNLHGSDPRDTLHVSNGSHLRYFKNKNTDLLLPRTPLFKRTKVSESNDYVLVFNTSILHAVLPVKGLPIFRMIASFVGDI